MPNDVRVEVITGAEEEVATGYLIGDGDAYSANCSALLVRVV